MCASRAGLLEIPARVCMCVSKREGVGERERERQRPRESEAEREGDLFGKTSWLLWGAHYGPAVCGQKAPASAPIMGFRSLVHRLQMEAGSLRRGMGFRTSTRQHTHRRTHARIKRTCVISRISSHKERIEVEAQTANTISICAVGVVSLIYLNIWKYSHLFGLDYFQQQIRFLCGSTDEQFTPLLLGCCFLLTLASGKDNLVTFRQKQTKIKHQTELVINSRAEFDLVSCLRSLRWKKTGYSTSIAEVVVGPPESKLWRKKKKPPPS